MQTDDSPDWEALMLREHAELRRDRRRKITVIVAVLAALLLWMALSDPPGPLYQYLPFD